MSEVVDPTPNPLPAAERGLSAPPSLGGKGAEGLGSRPRRLRRVAVIVASVAVVAVAVWFFAFHEPEPRDDAERFQGDWRMTVAGRATPIVVQVNGDRWQTVSKSVEGKAYRITLNETANPKEIDLDPIDTSGFVGPAPKLLGVYAFENNKTVRVRVAPGVKGRPKTLDDPEAIVWLLNKVKLEPAPPSE